MEELPIITGSDLIDGGWIEVYEDAARDELSRRGFGEDGVQLAGFVECGCCRVGTAVAGETVLEEVTVCVLVT
jgi:hypothetical protein